MHDFSKLLDEKLNEIQRSNRWLAQQVNMHPATIGNYRKGNSEPSISDAFRIAEVIGLDLSKVYGVKEVIKHSMAREKEEQARTVYFGQEAFVELNFFPDSRSLLASLKQSQDGLTIDFNMVKKTIPIVDSQYEEGMFAVKVDQACDCDEDYGIAFGIPWKGHIEEGKPILFTTDPPSKLVIRRVLVHEDGRFIFKESYLGSNSIKENDIIIIAALKYRLESL